MQREPILMKKLDRDRARGKLVIGLIGTHSGAGVTHLGISLAAYFSEYQRRNTAYVECSSHNDLSNLQKNCTDISEDTCYQGFFTHRRVTFYKNRNLLNIPEIIGGQFECIILDMGTDIVKNKSEFLRCDKKIVVSSLAVWKRQELNKFILNTAHINNCEQWIYAIPFTTNKEIKEALKKQRKKLYAVPYEPDPFYLTKEVIQLFQRLF